jgi:hypothetical protein
MDYGNDPLISSRYAQEHKTAADMTKPTGMARISTVRDRLAWSKRTPAQLKDSGITPEMLVASGAKWDVLQRRHGVDALLDYGMRWPHLLRAGFKGASLRSVTPLQMARLGLNATRTLECRPSAADLGSLGMSAVQLRDAGWNADLLRAIGVNCRSMVDFGWPLKDWALTLGVTDFQSFGFDTYANCATAGWSRADIQLALAPIAPAGQMTKNAAPALKKGLDMSRIQFI